MCSFSSFGLFKVHFPALEQHRREVYLLIYIDILIGLHQCINAERWCPSLHWCSGADIHVSYFRLAQIIPVNENLIVFPLPSGLWTGGNLSPNRDNI